MRKPIIGRYECTDEGQIIIDVSIQSIEHLYSNFDRTSPYHKKELDTEFADYLIDSVREIQKNDFLIRITLPISLDAPLKERVCNSIGNYFHYLKVLEKRTLKTMFKRSSILFIAGLVLLIFAIVLTRQVSSNWGVFLEVFSQGVTVAAWVALWESMANIFLEWHPHQQKIGIFARLMQSQVIFQKCPPPPNTSTS